MLDPKPLTPTLSVSGQIFPEEVADLAERGVRVLINNRPDHEEAGQPTHHDMQAAASAAGIDYYHLPVVMGQLDPDTITQFRDALAKTDGQTHAFCKSGGRSAMMWALSQAGTLSADEIVAAAAAQGYDLSGLRPVLD